MSIGSVEASASYAPGSPGGNDDKGAFAAAACAYKSSEKAKQNGAPPPADAGSADWQTFKAGNATGDAPPDLQPPPGTTAQDVADAHPGLVENVNKMKWEGKAEGDTFAQQHGFKDLKDMLSSKSPEAAKATSELAWDAQASNNATKADGAARPDQERTSNTESGIRGSGEVDPGSTGAILQDKLVHGQSINGKTTFATKRTYEDGESKSNATMVGNRIADAFKKVLQYICPPLGDLVQMAQDGATKVRDKSVGDNDAAGHDDKKIQEDGKNFGKDFGEFAVNFIPGAGEIAGAVAKVGETIGKVAGGAVKGGAEAAGDVAKGGAEAAGGVAKGGAEAAGGVAKAGGEVAGAAENTAGSVAKSLSEAMAKMQDTLFGSDFVKGLKIPKDATPEEKKAFVKEKVDQVIDNVMDQIDFTQFVPSQPTPQPTPQPAPATA